MEHRSFHYAIDAVASVVGKNISVDEWAEQHRVPDRKDATRTLDGADIRRITGVERKSWDPALFRDFSPIVEVVREAVHRADVAIEKIDAVLLVTSTPFYAQLGMDGFELLRRLGVPDHVVPIQLQAGCAAMARAMHVLGHMNAERALIIAYEVSSPYMVSPVYYQNREHPLREHLWMSAALFGDGAAALVVSRREKPTGFSFYSRDSQSFGDGPAFDDPLIHYPGGGALHPPGTAGAEDMAAFGMNGEATKRYYAQGMMLNHRTFAARMPDYLKQSKRIYMHQASPRLVEEVRKVFMTELGVKSEQIPTNARMLGNIVAPATLKLLDDDVCNGAVGPGDQVCFSVVGAGPERGGFVIPLGST
jgi:3-oxoacyl-[acyl-carrier-protein] synthase III